MHRGQIAWRCLDCSDGKAEGVPGAVDEVELPEGMDAVWGVKPFKISCIVKSLVTFYTKLQFERKTYLKSFNFLLQALNELLHVSTIQTFLFLLLWSRGSQHHQRPRLFAMRPHNLDFSNFFLLLINGLVWGDGLINSEHAPCDSIGVTEVSQGWAQQVFRTVVGTLLHEDPLAVDLSQPHCTLRWALNSSR